jgi:hypothetical protein
MVGGKEEFQHSLLWCWKKMVDNEPVEISVSEIFLELDFLRARSGLSADDFSRLLLKYTNESESAIKSRRTQSAPGSSTPHSDLTSSSSSFTCLECLEFPNSDAAHSFIETVEVTKYDTFVYPSGHIDDFHKGLSGRIGFPHLEFFSAMEQEHCQLAGADIEFTTRNYGIRTTPHKEWLYVVAEKPHKPEPPQDQLRHDRIIPDISEKMKCKIVKDADLRREEVIAVCLYTGWWLRSYSYQFFLNALTHCCRANVHGLQLHFGEVFQASRAIRNLSSRWQSLHYNSFRFGFSRSKAQSSHCHSRRSRSVSWYRGLRLSAPVFY